MEKQPDLNALFNKFAGREVPISCEAYDPLSDRTVFIVPANKPEPVFEEMKKVAADNGLQRHIWLSVMDAPRSASKTRVHVRLEKGADKKWRISNKFAIG